MTATTPYPDRLLAIRQRRLRYLGHILRMPESRVVRRALVALAKGSTVYPRGSLFMDCQAITMAKLVALAQRRLAWNAVSDIDRAASPVKPKMATCDHDCRTLVQLQTLKMLYFVWYNIESGHEYTSFNNSTQLLSSS